MCLSGGQRIPIIFCFMCVLGFHIRVSLADVKRVCEVSIGALSVNRCAICVMIHMSGHEFSVIVTQTEGLF